MEDHHHMMHMQIPMSLKSIVTVVSLLLLLSSLPQSKCQPHPSNYSVCRNGFYNCGTLSNISYPFWGQKRPSFCGADNLFNLHCHDNQITAIQIWVQDFKVKEINTNTYIIKMVRTELNVCSPYFDDGGTLLSDPTLFRYPDTQSVLYITIFYGCPSIDPYDGNRFTCGRDGGGSSTNKNGTYCKGVVDDELLNEIPSLWNCGKRIQNCRLTFLSLLWILIIFPVELNIL